MNTQARQAMRTRFEALAPKGSIKINRYLYMRRVSTQALQKLQALGYTVILVGGSK